MGNALKYRKTYNRIKIKNRGTKIMKRSLVKNQKGFTLIEIIAVLVILGIMAAVAIPKYIDMSNDARGKAVQGALASGASQVTMQYSKMLFTAVSASIPMTSVASALTGPLLSQGDYVLTYTGSAGGTMTIAVTGPATLLPSGTVYATAKTLLLY
jgi:MSHA pilin protein MshA